MGQDAEAVTDSTLRVKGVERLWVADCSVMPSLVSGDTNLPAIMIGERASDDIGSNEVVVILGHKWNYQRRQRRGGCACRTEG